MNFKPGMILLYGKIAYRVECVLLGTVPQVDLIGLSCVTEKNRNEYPIILVPMKILEASLLRVEPGLAPRGECYGEVGRSE